LNPLEQEVCDFCNPLLRTKDRIRMLEAGCGSGSHVEFESIVDCVGIDISREQLDRNTTVQEKILGDIQDYPLPKEEFDVAVCWWVLEHLSRPRNALANLFGSVRPGGLVILAFPNLLSFKGLVTKFTPFWFHKFFYHFTKISADAFPTHFRVAILPRNVARFAQENGFSVLYFKLGEGRVTERIRTTSCLAGRTFALVDSVLKTISFGKLDSLLLDCCVMVLVKGKGSDECDPAVLVPHRVREGQTFSGICLSAALVNGQKG
jgi:SAM-dependent methyltransferase